MKLTKAQHKLLDDASKRPDGHIVGGDPRTRQWLIDHGLIEVYGHHFGPLFKLTDKANSLYNKTPGKLLGTITSFSEDTLTGMVRLDDGREFNFHSVSFGSDSCFRWPRECEMVEVVLTNAGTLLSLHGV